MDARGGDNYADQMDLTADSSVLLLIRNIPSDFHSRDLRAFFSLLVERSAFKCFHFRQRPETLTPTSTESSKANEPPVIKTLCCFVKIRLKFVEDLFARYNGKHWEDGRNQLLATRCHILRVRIQGSSDNGSAQKSVADVPINKSMPYMTRQERDAERKYHFMHQNLRESDVTDLIEMKPPSIMPFGNVGTPTKNFLQLISNCQMPAGLIKKLGLRFPKGRKNRKFGQVGLDYGGTILTGDSGRNFDLDDDDEGGASEFAESASHPRKLVWFSNSESERPQGDDGDDLDNDDCQEWERHEALNDDVTTHERNKERLFEDDAEVVWEKGGPGIVWNMDANFWKEQGGGDDLDEATDDWDVDMSCYYEDAKDRPGDRDARDFMQIRKEKEMRAGAGPSIFQKPTPRPPSQLPRMSHDDYKSGTFERHTKGIGRKLLEKSGWEEGSGVGKWKKGIVDPVSSDGQMPYTKRGLGYSGKGTVKLRNTTDAVSLIHKQAALEPGNFGITLTTMYDRQDATDTLKRRAISSNLSYRSPDL